MNKRSAELQDEVLAVLRSSREPLSAYGVLDKLSATNRRIAPPTVYRALAALTERNRVHRLESLSAYIACTCEQHADAAVLAICDECGVVEESVATDVMDQLTSHLGKSGFAALRHVIEVRGVCAECTAQQGAA